MTEPTTLSTYNLADVWEAIADRVADRVAIISEGREITYRELEERSNRFAHALFERGVRAGDHVAVYLLNGIEYFEALLAAYKLRAVPVNINYRYVKAELEYLFDNSDSVAVIANEQFVPRLAETVPNVEQLRHVFVVRDGSTGPDLPEGYLDYDAALAQASPERDFAALVGERSDDDTYVIYTGGTTGMPKGVVWRHEDIFFAGIGGGDPMRLNGFVSSPPELIDRIIDFDMLTLPLAPMMHAAAQWTSLSWLFCGGKIAMVPGSFDPLKTWQMIEDHKVGLMIIVGDAMAKPLLDAWEAHGPFDVASMYAIGSGGAPLNPAYKKALFEILPNAMITDGFGSSETGAQGSHRIFPGDETDGKTRFSPMDAGTTVLDDDFNIVEPGSGVLGRVALTGHIPLRYYNDPDKTAATFVEAGGKRWVITGDMAMVEADGIITLLGRGNQVINTGGEKVYPEEVESVLRSHEAVYDAVVTGVADDRFGQTVCAVVQWVPGAEATLEDLREFCRAELAGYKLPRQLVVVDEVVRSPVGKADYVWAKKVANESLGLDA
ncbi:MAG: acyl-CoA synthetase [Actinobacteria bacterium]|nr:acyl-CoA synthetase [Actinomycetota bacterium]